MGNKERAEASERGGAREAVAPHFFRGGAKIIFCSSTFRGSFHNYADVEREGNNLIQEFN